MDEFRSSRQSSAHSSKAFGRPRQVVVLLLAAVLALASAKALGAEHFVTVRAEPNQDRYLPDETGQIAFSFSLADAIKLNRLPPIRIEIDDPADLTFRATTFASMDISEEEIDRRLKEAGLSPNADIYFRTLPTLYAIFRVLPDAPPGRRELTFHIAYYFCSTRLGVCSRNKEVLRVPLTIADQTSRR